MCEKRKCCYQKFQNSRYYPCGNNAKVLRDGKNFCGVHDPERLQAIHDATSLKYKQRRDARNLVWERQDAERAACHGVETELLTPGILRRLLEKPQ